jgi:hypothetical protein
MIGQLYCYSIAYILIQPRPSYLPLAAAWLKGGQIPCSRPYARLGSTAPLLAGDLFAGLALPTAPRQLPWVSGSNCRNVARQLPQYPRYRLSRIGLARLLVSCNKISSYTATGFYSVSFLRASPCYTLTQTGN